MPMFGFPWNQNWSDDILLNLGLYFNLREGLHLEGDGLLAVKDGHGNILSKVLGVEGEVRGIAGEAGHEVVGMLDRRGGTIGVSCF